QDPSAPDVRVERRYWVPVRDADDRLGGEVDDGINLVFAEGSLHQGLIAQVATDDADAFQQPAPDQFAVRIVVAQQAHHVCAAVDQVAHHEPADEARGPGDEGRA